MVGCLGLATGLVKPCFTGSIHLVAIFIMHECLTKWLRKPLPPARKESRKKERINAMIQKTEQILKVFLVKSLCLSTGLSKHGVEFNRVFFYLRMAANLCIFGGLSTGKILSPDYARMTDQT
jgi:hypothetical protein